MEKRELVAMFMESPFYFDLRLRERLVLVQQNQRRFSISTKAGQVNLAEKGSFDWAMENTGEVVTVIVRFNPPSNPAGACPSRLEISEV